MKHEPVRHSLCGLWQLAKAPQKTLSVEKVKNEGHIYLNKRRERWF